MIDGEYCCLQMREKSNPFCRHHGKEYCPDQLISYKILTGDSERYIEAKLIRIDESGITINHKIRYCPWCGTDLEMLSGETIGLNLIKSKGVK